MVVTRRLRRVVATKRHRTPRWATRRPPAAAGPALPAEAYTPWLTRVLAWLIDFIPVAILEGIGWGLLVGTQ